MRMTGAAPNISALWDDYGYHHDDLVEPTSLVPVAANRSPRPAAGARGGRVTSTSPVARRSRHFAGTDGACEEMPSWWGFCLHEEACAICGVMLRRCIPRWECPDLSPA